MGSITENSPGFFASASRLSSDTISARIKEYAQDNFAHKVNLCQSVCHDERGNPSALPSVREATRRLAEKDCHHKSLPTLGHPGLRQAVVRSVLGEQIASNKGSQFSTCQSISEIGAFSLASKLIARHHSPKAKVYLPEPTCSNYVEVAAEVGLVCEPFNHYDYSRKLLDMDSYRKMLLAALPGSAILLYACGNDPTGIDPSEEEWMEIGKIIKERNLFPIFNAAYLGLSSGSLDKDAFAIRYFINELDIETAICVSYDYSMGLYGESVSCLLVYTSSDAASAAYTSYLEQIQRSQISHPSQFGASIAHLILTDDGLSMQWANDLAQLVNQNRDLRRLLYDCLLDQAIPGQWNHINRQRGMFGYLGLSHAIVKELRETYHIYMADNSRIAMTALNEGNIMYVAIAMADCVRSELLNDF